MNMDLTPEYLNCQYKVWDIFWRPETWAGNGKYVANESLYLLQHIFKPYTNSKKLIKKAEPGDALSYGSSSL